MEIIESIGNHGPAGTSPKVSGSMTDTPAPEQRLTLYGSRIFDLTPRGDLRIGLVAEGPVCLALIRGYRRNGRFASLPSPVVLDVPGDGQPAAPGDGDAEAGERVWEVAVTDRALLLDLRHGTVAALLGCESKPGS